MADPKSPMVTEIVNNPSPEFNYNIDNQKIPTLFAVNQLFSGLNANPDGTTVNADNIKLCGVFRFDPGKLNGIPTEVTTGGILVIHTERPEKTTFESYQPEFGGTAADTTGYTGKNKVRQILWPDGPENITPYTRTCNNGEWTQWQTLGGNLRRVKLDSNKTALGNVMYYSFGNYTLTLPDPATLAPGTKVALEQYTGTGTVKWVQGSNTYTQATEPAFQADEEGAPTSTKIGPHVYYFEVIISENGNSREWIMDVDNDLSMTVTGIRGDISDESLARQAGDAAEAALRKTAIDNLTKDINDTLGLTIPAKTGNPIDARITNLENVEVPALEASLGNKNKIDKVYRPASNVALTTAFPDGNGVSRQMSALLTYVNPTFVVGGSGLTINLPAASTALLGSEVNIEVPGAWTVTVVAGSDSETFTNDTGAILLLPFRCEYGAASTPIWTLTVIS